MTTETINKTLFEDTNCMIGMVEGHPTNLVVSATGDYIPLSTFKNLFNKVAEITKEKGNISKVIFDKRALKVFNQPSMEWYFVEWKKTMFDLGVKEHRKILPDDATFKKSVELARKKLDNENPDALYHQTTIEYRNNLEEALND